MNTFHPEIIHSETNPKIKFIKQLLNSAVFRKKNPFIIVENPRALDDVINNRPADISFIIYSSLPESFSNSSALSSIKSYKITEQLFKQISTVKQSQGILAVVKRPEWDINKIIAKARHIVLLDKIQSALNMGAVIRNAAAFNMDLVLYTTGSVDPFHPDAIRGMAANCFQVPILECSDSLFQKIMQHGFKIYVFDAQKGTLLPDCKFKDKTLFIFGSERAGIVTDYLNVDPNSVSYIRIPINPDVDSLNAAVSSGIVFYEYITKFRCL
ncbi:TrmH family RNA methyltransferase [Thermoproteota archaeon]